MLSMLTPGTLPKWGKMTAQHMVEHLILAFRMGNGKLKVDCINPTEKLLTLKRFLLSDRPLPKNFVNSLIGEDLPQLMFAHLQEAKENLKKEVDDYYSYFETNPEAKLMNATFGELNKDEWEIFHAKHLKHHFEQFEIYRKFKK